MMAGEEIEVLKGPEGFNEVVYFKINYGDI
jgi:hypothetical protein